MSASLPHKYLEAIELFNRGEYFECHELLEDLWRPAEGLVRNFLQGLIQVAVALHHESRGNAKGARGLYERGRGRLVSAREIESDLLHAIDVERLLDQLDHFFMKATDWLKATDRVAPQMVPRAAEHDRESMLSTEKLQFEFVIGEESLRLDQFVCRELPRISQTRVRRMIAESDVLVNDAASLKGYKLKSGDRVVVSVHAADKSSATPEPIPLDVLYEDRDLIVVDKPQGLLVHPNHIEKSGTLTNGLAWHFWKTEGEAIRPGLVHRLDRQTSGAIVVAKTARAHRTLSKHFRERWVKKVYLALVSGIVGPERGEIDAPIGSNPTTWPRWQVMESGRAAKTSYRVRRRFAAHTLLELEPLTGRTHQLRIHCALIGHPIVGDTVYATSADPIVRQQRLKVQLLHAWQLQFRHPATNEEIRCEAPIPAVMQEVLKSLTEEGEK